MRQSPEGAKRVQAFLERWRIEREGICESRIQSVLGKIVQPQAVKKATNQTYCRIHPRYGGMRPPKTGCKECWQFYNSRHGLSVEED